MKKENLRNFCVAICLLLAFLLWTMAVKFIDVEAIGPQNSSVGFATINKLVHNLTGVHMQLYLATDWLGLVPLIFVVGFGALGLFEWIKKKHLLKIEFNIIILGVFYIVVLAVYILFEIFVVNYRPVLIDGVLEASYPSSTTILVMCVMPTAIIQFNRRIKNKMLKRFIISLIIIFIAFMVICRLISGVHWFTDIIGGALLSSGLIMTYHAIIHLNDT